ncbi:pectinesterase family protein [Chengkuizengella sediminis]|uniref:pectinesterase family protein n=1 Tax=Chengkuizengella sediminis TaxID=1885917 RepID=UPI00138A5EF4|nr:hypothetical protein [Chengkuizengella sediminis]
MNAGVFIGEFAIDSVIRSNNVRGNNSDIEDNGVDTVFDDNKCTTSDPAGLCRINNEVIVIEGESIQAAIDAVTTTEGFTIRIGVGIFNEAITVPANKDRIRIIGAGEEKTMIEGNDLGNVIGINIDGSSFVTI